MMMEWRAFETTQACVGYDSIAGNTSHKQYQASKLEELSGVSLLRSSKAKSRHIQPHTAPPAAGTAWTALGWGLAV